MKADKVKMYKKILLEEKAKLLKGIRKGGDREPPKELGEVASNLTDDELRMGLTENELRILDQVESALDRIQNGTYGECALCGDPIGEERLKAIPFARLCISCQSDVEKRKDSNPYEDSYSFWVGKRDEEFTSTVEEEE